MGDLSDRDPYVSLVWNTDVACGQTATRKIFKKKKNSSEIEKKKLFFYKIKIARNIRFVSWQIIQGLQNPCFYTTAYYWLFLFLIFCSTAYYWLFLFLIFYSTAYYWLFLFLIFYSTAYFNWYFVSIFFSSSLCQMREKAKFCFWSILHKRLVICAQKISSTCKLSKVKLASLTAGT